MPYLLQGVMMYSFGLNTELQIDSKSIPHTDTAELVLWRLVHLDKSLISSQNPPDYDQICRFPETLPKFEAKHPYQVW